MKLVRSNHIQWQNLQLPQPWIIIVIMKHNHSITKTWQETIISINLLLNRILHDTRSIGALRGDTSLRVLAFPPAPRLEVRAGAVPLLWWPGRVQAARNEWRVFSLFTIPRTGYFAYTYGKMPERKNVIDLSNNVIIIMY